LTAPGAKNLDDRNANSKAILSVDAVTIVGKWDWSRRIETSEDEVRGINTKSQLAAAEAVMQARHAQGSPRAGDADAPETSSRPDTLRSDVTSSRSCDRPRRHHRRRA